MPQVYGWEHIIYLTIVIGIMITLFILIKKYVKEEKQVILSIKITGVALLIAIVWNRLSICLTRDHWNFLPDSFCGTTSLALSLSAIFLKKDHKIFHCVAYLGLLGGSLTLIYPDFIGQADSIFYPMTISGLIHHTISVFIVILMLKTGFLKPQLRKWYLLPLGLSGYMTYGIFLITVLNYDNALYIYEPILSGTKLNWFVLGIIFLTMHAVFLTIWEYAQKYKFTNNLGEAND